MDVKSENKVNEQFVLVLKEDANHLLTIHQHPIASSDVIVSKIEAIVKNPHKTLWDLFSEVECYLNYDKEYKLCFPYGYRETFIEPAKCPGMVTYNSYNDSVEEYRKSIEASHKYKQLDELRKETYLKKRLSTFEEDFSLKERSRKKKYAEKAIRFIQCKKLNKAISEVKKDKYTKMYSSDSIGWTTFEYPITDEINVMLNTNFVYGKSAYFYLTVKYQDIVLIPYSDLVNYYYANMKTLISYTRSYACNRNSWNFALRFVADFANEAKISPRRFIHKYMVSEITEMMKGLRATIRNPEEVLKNIKEHHLDYIDFSVIRPFMHEDEKIFKMMPKESISVFKAEKISGALLFLNSLKQLQSFWSEVSDIIAEIRDMNASIKPEVESVVENITNDIIPLEEKQEHNYKQLDNIKKKISFHKFWIQLQIKKSRERTKQEVIDNYKAKHPIYVDLLDEREDLQLRIDNLDVIISRRKSLLKRMKKCLNRINKEL